MDSQRRMLLAIVLSAIVIFGSELLFMKPSPAHGLDAGTPAAEELPSAEPSTGNVQTQVAPPVPSAAAAAGAAMTPKGPRPPVRELRVDRTLSKSLFSSRGAGLVFDELVGPKMREQEEVSLPEAYGRLVGKTTPPAPQMNLALPIPGEPLPLSVSVEGLKPFPADADYTVQEDPVARTLTFRATDDGWEVTKAFTWSPDGFELSMLVSVKNVSGEPRSGELAVHTDRAVDPALEKAPSMLGGVGNQSKAGCAVGESYESELPKGKPPVEKRGPIHFFGIDQQYFLTAVYPLRGPREGRCVMTATPSERRSSAYFPLELQPGQTATSVFGVFLGPKQEELLASAPSPDVRGKGGGGAPALGVESWSPHLERTINLGVFAVICKVLIPILKFFHAIIHNWGVAIILLTVAVRIVLTPINHRAMVGQEAMRKLQPKIEALKKKYPDDKERQQMEMMSLYREAGVNPFGSCMLMVIQIPIWWALYSTLRNMFELYREPFFGPIWTDLTYKDPTYLLPVLLGISQILTTRLQPQMMDPSQAKLMNWFMPIVFTLFLFQYPVGLILYIFASNVITVAQQYASRRIIARSSAS